MLSHDGRYILTFNGEIYNYRELREQLRALGHEFQTECDTEVLLAATR
jgi:asparagine synthase (glutamine-hydrolysing)